MGRLTDLVRRATASSASSPSPVSALARALALRVIDRALSTGRRLGDLADAVRPALGAAPSASATPRHEGAAAPVDTARREPARAREEPIEVVPRPAKLAEVGVATSELSWTLARHVSETSSAHVAVLLDADPWTDAETLRTIRVASRKLRVLVASFEPVLRPKLARRLRRNLRRVGRALGPVREYDVVGTALQTRLSATSDGAQAAAIEHVLVDIARRRDAARVEARRTLDQLDRTRLRRDLDQAIAAAIAPIVRVGADPASEAWALLRPQIDAELEAAPLPVDLGDEAAVHAVRIGAKRLRYVYDLLEPAFTDHHVRKALKLVQRTIGDTRDRRQLADLVATHRSALAALGHVRLAAGLAPLVETLHAEADAAHASIGPALAAFDRARIVSATQAALGLRTLTIVHDDAEPIVSSATSLR